VKKYKYVKQLNKTIIKLAGPRVSGQSIATLLGVLGGSGVWQSKRNIKKNAYGKLLFRIKAKA
jgi:hypothetical protein